MDEKRRSVRLSIDIPVKIRYNGVTTPGKTRNLSCGGIYVQTPNATPPQGNCELILTLPDGKAPMVVKSDVVWKENQKENEFDVLDKKQENPELEQEQEDDGAGLQFQTLDPDQKARINEFIQRTIRENLH